MGFSCHNAAATYFVVIVKTPSQTLTVGVVIALLVAMAKVLGVPSSADDPFRELRDIGVRFAALNAESKRLFVIGAILALGLAVHLMYSLSRAMRPARPAE